MSFNFAEVQLICQIRCSVTYCHGVLQVALPACKEAAGSVREVHFVLFSSGTYNVWKEEASRLFEGVE